MKILFAIKSLNVAGGGAERVLVYIANGLSKRGNEIKIMTFDCPEGEPFYDVDPAIQRIDLNFGQPGQPTAFYKFLRAIPKIRRAVKVENADLVVAFMHSTYVPVGIALLGMGVKLIASEHVGVAHFHNRPIQKVLAQIIQTLSVAKTVPSIVIREEHSIHLQNNIHVLPNPINLVPFNAVADQKPDEPPILLSVGRLMEEKNHTELISAFALLASEFPEWKLRIVGEGELRPQLEEQISALGLIRRISMPGVIKEIASEYAKASIVVVPSLYESFGMVTAESLASARPVISFKECTGSADLIENGKNGLLVESNKNRTEALSEVLAKLMSNSALREKLSLAAPKSVRQFDLSSTMDIWENFFLSYKNK